MRIIPVPIGKGKNKDILEVTILVILFELAI